MKKLIIAVAAIFTLGAASAQKGSVLLYGNLDADFQNNNGGSAITINPGIGFGLSPNWTLGADLGLTTLSSDRKGLGESSAYQLGAFLRYAKPVSNIFSLYAQLGTGYMGNSYDPTDGLSAITKGNGFYANITPAVFVNVKNGFGLDFSFGNLGFNSFKVDGADKANSAFGLNFGKSMKIGVSKTFGGKK